MLPRSAGIIDRFGKPSKELMVDFINAWNRTRLTTEQLRFTDVTTLSDTGLAQVSIEFEHHTGWSSDSTPLTYYRYAVSSITNGAPIVIHTESLDPDEIYSAIYEQYGLLFERDLSTLNLVQGEPEDDNFDLVIHDDHLIFYGTVRVIVRPAISLNETRIDSKMDLRLFYADGNRQRPPIELYATRGEFHVNGLPTEHQRLFEYELRKISEQSSIAETSPILDLLELLTGDEWVSVPEESPFNLYGARFVYNDRTSADYPITDHRYNYVLVLELGDLCTNLSGMLRIAYRYAEQRPLTNQPNNASIFPIFQR